MTCLPQEEGADEACFDDPPALKRRETARLHMRAQGDLLPATVRCAEGFMTHTHTHIHIYTLHTAEKHNCSRMWRKDGSPSRISTVWRHCEDATSMQAFWGLFPAGAPLCWP